MRKKIIVLSLVLACGMLALACKPKAPAQPAGGNANAAVNQNTNAAPQEESYNGSVSDLMLKGMPTKCTFSQTVSGVTQNGVAYVSGANVKTEMSVTEAGKTVTTYMIKAGDWQYVWGDAMAGQGTKFMLTAAEMKAIQEKSKAQAGNQEQNKVDLDSQMNMKCTPWVTDSSLFIPPADITFNDVTAMMKSVLNMGTNQANDTCAVCDMAPAAAKAQCLKSCKQ